MSVPQLPYSGAPRCRPCGMKASLEQVHAERLDSASGNLLAAYPCPVGDGWHVRRTDRQTGPLR